MRRAYFSNTFQVYLHQNIIVSISTRVQDTSTYISACNTHYYPHRSSFKASHGRYSMYLSDKRYGLVAWIAMGVPREETWSMRSGTPLSQRLYQRRGPSNGCVR
jgi:hypothetical protein